MGDAPLRPPAPDHPSLPVREPSREFSCRSGCAACCIAPSISSPIPGMPHGKPAGVRCVQLTADLRQITGGIVRGEGTMGQLLTNRTLYDRLTQTLVATDDLLQRLQTPNGTFGKMLDDPTLYNQMTATLNSLDSTVRMLSSPEGTLGRLVGRGVLEQLQVGVDQEPDEVAPGDLLRVLRGREGRRHHPLHVVLGLVRHPGDEGVLGAEVVQQHPVARAEGGGERTEAEADEPVLEGVVGRLLDELRATVHDSRV